MLIQRNVGGDIHGSITGYPVIITGRKHYGVDIQEVEHIRDGNLRVELLKDQNTLALVSIKLHITLGRIIGDAADVGGRMIIEDPVNPSRRAINLS